MFPSSHRYPTRIVPLVLFLVVSMGPWCSRSAPAQSGNRFRAGDEVIANFLGEWRPAKVLQADQRGQVLVEVEFAGSTQRRTFKLGEVRFPHEADAIYATRTWTDSSGTFRVQAALLALDKSTATLRKPDMAELKVPITSLSERDQKFLARLEREMGPIAPRGPELTEFSTALPAPAFESAGDRPSALTPDPAPAYETLVQGGFAFPMASVRLEQGQTAQGEVSRYQRPNPQFFEQVEIPAQVSDPTKREGLGVTRVSTRGLEPQSAP